MDTQTIEVPVVKPLTPERILQTGLGFWASKTFLSAVEIGIFTELADGPQEFESLAARLDLHPRSAQDFLDTLVVLGFLQRENGWYRNSDDADLFLDRHKPGYVGGILEMANARLYGFWGNLTEALRTGRHQNETKHEGSEATFDTLYADPARLKGFLSAMSGVSRGANKEIARQVAWDQYNTFADIGTAQGDLAVQIALANPHLAGIGFDLAAVAPIFEEYARQNGLGSRLRFQAGNFFNDRLPRVDVITMGHILHDWDLEQKKMLVAKAYEALNPGGLFVVYDSMIDDARSTNLFGLLMSLNMLIETPGGFDYTGADCKSWLQEAGFRNVAQHHLIGPDSMVIGQKPE